MTSTTVSTSDSGPRRAPVSFASAVSLGVGTMIGAGIFALLGQAGAIAGNLVWASFVIGGVERDYLDLFRWIAPAGVAYLPATVVPVGTSADGLPIGVQIVGPFLEDRTTIAVAGMIADLVGGCPRPPLAV